MQHWFSLPPRVALLGVVLASNTATLRAQQEALGPMVELSIDEALSRALRDSEEVKLARAAVELAAAEVTIARSAAFPQVNTSLAYVRTFQSAFSSGFQLPHFPRFAPNPSAPLESRVRYLEQNAQTAAFSVIQDLVDGQALSLPFGRAHTYSTGLTASQLLFAGGRVKAGIEIAQHSYAAADYALAEEIAEIQLQVRAVYYQALFAQEVETIAQAALVQAASFLNQERLRLQAGYASDLDVLRAEVSLANIRPQLVEARNATSLALLNLKRIVNVPLQQPVRLTTPLEAPTAAELTRTGLAPEVLQAQRSAVSATERQVAIREQGVRVARSAFLPTVSVQTVYAGQAFPQGLFDFTGLRWQPDWTASVSIQLPIFTGFRRQAEMAQAKVELRRAELQLTQLREVVDLQYEQALGEKERIRATIAARQRTVEQAQRVYDLTVLRYEQGLATQLEVSDSRLALLQARTNLAQALADFYISDAGVTGATPGSGNVAPAIQPRMPGTGAVNQPPNPIRFFQIASPLGSPNDARRLDDPQARQQ